MRRRFSHRRFALPFAAPVRTTHGRWVRREGVIVRIEGEDGKIGFGEAAPIPGFGLESVDRIDGVCRGLGGEISGDRMRTMYRESPILHIACTAALAELTRDAADRGANSDAVAVAALLPAGVHALGIARTRGESGFRTFKWKVGVGDIRAEIGLLDELFAVLPSGSRMRLDANGGWDRRTAERWLDICAARPVEFVEQPSGEADLLEGLAADYPTPIALDESVATAAGLEDWIRRGWKGLFVIKPSLHSLQTMGPEQISRCVLSSALETRVGCRHALRMAFRWPRDRAIGFGVWPLFADARFDGPAAAPFIRWSDVESLNPEVAWNALS